MKTTIKAFFQPPQRNRPLSFSLSDSFNIVGALSIREDRLKGVELEKEFLDPRLFDFTKNQFLTF